MLGAPANALEVTAGDYEVYPAGVNIGVLYYQHFQTSDLYADGNRVSSNFDLKRTCAQHHLRTPDRSALLDPTTQFQIQLGKDLSVDNGPKEGARINLRLAEIF